MQFYAGRTIVIHAKKTTDHGRPESATQFTRNAMNQPPASPPPESEKTAAKEVEEALDEALKEGFPASDPVAIDIEHPAKALEEP